MCVTIIHLIDVCDSNPSHCCVVCVTGPPVNKAKVYLTQQEIKRQSQTVNTSAMDGSGDHQDSGYSRLMS